jgi:hypothetical protein
MLVIRRGQEPVEVRSGAEPFQLTLLTICLAWGVITLSALPQIAGATARSLPTWSVYLFSAALAAGSALALVGVAFEWFKKSLIGVYIERAGLTALAGLALGYSVWVVSALGFTRSAFAVLFLAIIWIGSGLRILLITLDLAGVSRRPR